MYDEQNISLEENNNSNSSYKKVVCYFKTTPDKAPLYSLFIDIYLSASLGTGS